MAYSPPLQRQGSCTCCPHVHLAKSNWCNSRRRTAAGFILSFDSDCDADEFGSFAYRPTQWTTAGTRLRGMWRRMTTEKKRPHAVPYDPNTYAQNFDDGSASVEPDNLSRSFSARFAVAPSRIMQRLS